MHTYEQTNKELTVLVPLPAADVRAKEIEWKCTTAELRVRARGAGEARCRQGTARPGQCAGSQMRH